jgi:hypothetical protein
LLLVVDAGLPSELSRGNKDFQSSALRGFARNICGTQFKDTRRDADDVDVAAGLEPGAFQPASHQPDLGFQEAAPPVSVFFDF